MAHTHHFHPAPPKQEKVSLDCSLPQPVSSIKRVTTALPFPTDISQALNYSAAYIDHAAHLAFHALEKFNNLRDDHDELLTKSGNQTKQILDLKCHVKDHEKDIEGLNSKYAELEKQRKRDAKEAKDREDLLKKQLNDAQTALKAANAYIAKDKVDDIKRDDAHHKHIDADHLIIKQAEERATKAEARCVQLQDLLDTANKKLVVAESNLKTTREQLAASVANVAKLTKDLAAETKEREHAQADLKQANQNTETANGKIIDLHKTVETRDAAIKRWETKFNNKDEDLKGVRAQLKAADTEVDAVKADRDRKIAEIESNKVDYDADLKAKDDTIAELQTHHKTVHEVVKSPHAHVKEVVDEIH